MVGYVYRITNIQTQKKYIGITEDFERRKRKHIKELKNNTHHSPKLQDAWNYWGENNFEWTVREVQINQYDDLYDIEIEEIKKYDSYNDGYNCNSGGRISDWKQKVRNEDIIKFLCIQWKYGDGYGKTCEQIFGWSKGTASAAKRKIRYIDANILFEKLTEEEKNQIATNTFEKYEINKKALKRQLTQGGCEKAYQLTQDDFNFAFAAQSLGYGYTLVANYLGIKPATVKDWFNGRSRKKEKETYLSLDLNSKALIENKVRNAQLSFLDKDVLIDKKEEDLMLFLCYDEFFPQRDADIQRLFGWSEGTCYHIREKSHYPKTKKKIELLDLQAKRALAEKLNTRLQSAMLKLRN